MDAGIGAMPELYDFLGCANFDEFLDHIAPLTDVERYRYLSDFLQTHDPTDVSEGYQALAALCAAAYFDLILTTNLDPLLGDAFAGARLRRKDYFLLINGVTRLDRMRLLLKMRSPRVKILKLHGDLLMRCMAWTVEEMEAYLSDIADAIKPAIEDRDVLVVGHSLRDERIYQLVKDAGGAIWYTHPSSVPDHLKGNPLVREVIGEKASFETLFVHLARELGVSAEPTAPSHETLISSATGEVTQAQTMDDFMTSVVGLAPDDQPSVGTGFVLADSRVIVSDPFSVHERARQWSVVTSDNRRLPTKVLFRDQSHPFGPVLLEVPAGLSVPGLVIDANPLHPMAALHVAVAAGERVGMSTGTLATAIEVTINVGSIGPVHHLIELDFATAPGSSGAPVVSPDFKVCGYIVAGTHDGQPPSFMYPASQWAQGIPDRI